MTIKTLLAILTSLGVLAPAGVWASADSITKIEQDMVGRAKFIELALRRIQSEIDLHQEINDLWVRCPAHDPTVNASECALYQTMVQNFPQMIQELRQDLALSYQDPIKQFFSFKVVDQVFQVNQNLNLQGTYKSTAWAALTPAEFATAEAALTKIANDAKTQAAQKYNNDSYKLDDFQRLLVREEREKHLQAYNFVMSRFPVLQYLSSAENLDRTLALAVQQVNQNLQAERTRLATRKAVLRKWIENIPSCARSVGTPHMSDSPSVDPCIFTPVELAELLKYESIINGLVIDFPQLAKVRDTIQFEQTVTATETVVLTFPTTITLFSLAPPIVGLAVAGSLGAVQYFHAQQEIEVTEQRELSWVYDTSVDESNPASHLPNSAQLTDARLERSLALTLGPTVLVGGAVAPYLLKLSPVVLNMIRSLQTLAKVQKGV